MLRTIVAVGAALAAVVGGARAQSSLVVVPSAFAAGEAPNSSPFPFAFSGAGIGRYQQVYDGAEVSAPGPVWITAVSFRANGNSALQAKDLDVVVALSTTASGPDNLSSTFSDNTGPDQTIVYAGLLSLPAVAASTGPAPFSWTIPFQTPFLRTGPGHLLLDMQILSSTGAGAGATLDAVTAAGDSVSRAYHSSDPASPTTSTAPSTTGVVTRFETVPAGAPFAQTSPSISAATGGLDSLVLHAGPSNAGRVYLVAGGHSGSAPGTPLPGGLLLPVNVDPITLTLLEGANGPTLPGFFGTLDPLGRAMAGVNVAGPLHPSAVGHTFSLAFFLFAPIDFVSNAIALTIAP